MLSPLAAIISHVERLLRLQYHTLLTGEVLTNLIKEQRCRIDVHCLPKKVALHFQTLFATQIPLVDIPRMLDAILEIQSE